MLRGIKDHVKSVIRASEVIGVLKYAIYDQRKLTYQELADILGTNTGKELNDALASIARDDFRNHRPIRPIIIINHTGIPDDGFFAYMNKIGAINGESINDFVENQLEQLGYVI